MFSCPLGSKKMRETWQRIVGLEKKLPHCDRDNASTMKNAREIKVHAKICTQKEEQQLQNLTGLYHALYLKFIETAFGE